MSEEGRDDAATCCGSDLFAMLRIGGAIGSHVDPTIAIAGEAAVASARNASKYQLRGSRCLLLLLVVVVAG